MKAVEEYIEKYTRNCSNELDAEYVEDAVYFPWLTPDHARSVAQIAREETIKEVCEWLDNYTMLSEKWYIEDLKKHLENKVWQKNLMYQLKFLSFLARKAFHCLVLTQQKPFAAKGKCLCL